MDDLMESSLRSMIHGQFQSWEQGNTVDEIKGALFNGCTEEDSEKKVYAKMILNAMEISTFISAKVILEILLTGGVIEPADESKLRKNILHIVKGQNQD